MASRARSDFIVATDTARFSQIFTLRGLSIDFGGSWLLPRLTSPLIAKRLAMLGEFIGAAEAERLGLVTWVKTEGEIDDFVAQLATHLSDGPSVAVSLTKELLHAGLDGSFESAVANETRAQVVNYATEDSLIARRTFAQRARGGDAPDFTGRWISE